MASSTALETIIGILVNLLLGFTVDVILFGTIGILVEIRDNLKEINREMKELEKMI